MFKIRKQDTEVHTELRLCNIFLNAQKRLWKEIRKDWKAQHVVFISG